jgi:hypothetical protein
MIRYQADFNAGSLKMKFNGDGVGRSGELKWNSLLNSSRKMVFPLKSENTSSA